MSDADKKVWLITTGAGRGMGVDIAKLANALVQLASQDEPPLRWAADAIGLAEQKAKDVLAQVDAHRDLSTALAMKEV
jgi:hypothetical protein